MHDDPSSPVSVQTSAAETESRFDCNLNGRFATLSP
jgi:hypothetical protein